MSIFEKLRIIQTNLKAPKDQFNDFGKYKYRSCESILEAVKPFLKDTETVILLNDELEELNGTVYVKATATLCDYDGMTVKAVAYAKEPKEKKGMDASQITGSTSSYARKYALNGLLCIDDNKDADTNESNGKPTATAVNAPVCECCGNSVLSYIGSNGKPVSVDKHIAGTREKFGKVLCVDCAKKYANNGN